MNIHCIQHVPFEDLAFFENWLYQNGHAVSGRTRIYDGEPLPPAGSLDWLFVMGGPMGVNDENTHPWLTREKRFIEMSIKEGKLVTGICLGAQIIASVLGAEVRRNSHTEIGWFPVTKTVGAAGTCFDPLPETFTPFHWHGDTFDIPDGAVRSASSEACPNQAFLYENRVLALQFHIEMTMDRIRGLIENCGDEIVPAPFIQKPDEMLQRAEREVPVMHSLLDDLLLAFIRTARQ